MTRFSALTPAVLPSLNHTGTFSGFGILHLSHLGGLCVGCSLCPKPYFPVCFAFLALSHLSNSDGHLLVGAFVTSLPPPPPPLILVYCSPVGCKTSAQKGPRLGLMLCYSCLKFLMFFTRGPAFSLFHWAPQIM